MRNGICPQCTAPQVYMLLTLGEQRGLYVGGWTSAKLTYYICTSCGYVEQYILDQQKLEKARENGEYVHPQGPQ